MSESKTRVLAILQNQWFKNPDSARRIYASHEGDRERSAKFRASALFMGCLTGRRIRDAFGEDMRHIVAYEEASPEIGGCSSAAFPADVRHIADAIEFWRPEIVIAFGKIAGDGVLQSMKIITGECQFYFRCAPHPAARHATVASELKAAATDVRSRLGLDALQTKGTVTGRNCFNANSRGVARVRVTQS